MSIVAFISLTLFISLYLVVFYYLIGAVIDEVGSKDVIIRNLGEVELDNSEALYMGLASGLAERFGLNIRFTQICLIILWLCKPMLTVVLYLMLYKLVKVANKNYELSHQEGLGGTVAVKYNGDTPDIVTAVEDPSDSNSYRDTVVGQVNEELSKITDVKIDTNKGPIEVSEELESEVDAFYKNKQTKQDDSGTVQSDSQD